MPSEWRSPFSHERTDRLCLAERAGSWLTQQTLVIYLLCQLKAESSVEKVVEEGKVTETQDRSPETVQGTSPLLAPLGFAFWRIKGAFEREMGISAGTWFTLALLSKKGGISQGELSQKFEIDPSRVTRLAKRLEREGLVLRKRDPEDHRI